VGDGSLRTVRTVTFRGPGDLISLSPDAALIEYDVQAESDRRQRDVYLQSTSDGDATPVLTGPSSDSVVGWSPDGRFLIFRSDRAGSEGEGLWALPIVEGRRTIALDGSAPQRLDVGTEFCLLDRFLPRGQP
jgi:Tol biopolymer transport system component